MTVSVLGSNFRVAVAGKIENAYILLQDVSLATYARLCVMERSICATFLTNGKMLRCLRCIALRVAGSDIHDTLIDFTFLLSYALVPVFGQKKSQAKSATRSHRRSNGIRPLRTSHVGIFSRRVFRFSVSSRRGQLV